MKAFSETGRQVFLAGTHVAVLSVAATGGRPPASVPIWYDYSPGGDIRISTTMASRKAKLILRAGAVTVVVQTEQPPYQYVVVQTEQPPYQYVVVEGTVVDTTTPTPREMIESTAIRYLGEEGGRAFVSSMASNVAHEDTVLFTIRPDRWFSADFSDEV